MEAEAGAAWSAGLVKSVSSRTSNHMAELSSNNNKGGEQSKMTTSSLYLHPHTIHMHTHTIHT